MVLQLFCGIFAWGFLAVLIWNLYKTANTGIVRLKKLHRIPCDRCVFFTGDYRLKCPVNPVCAGSEEAVNCRDFQSQHYCLK